MLIFTGICMAGCQKENVAPDSTPTKANPKSSPSTNLNQDTISNDTTRGYLRLQLAKDAVNADNILLEFSPAAKCSYSGSEDARTFQGMGQVSLSSLSSDNVALAINSLPLSTKGTVVGLVVNAKSTGAYKLNLSAIHTIPASIDIWLKDKYKKDSLDFRQYPSYAFNITADTNTFGSHRFSVVMRAHH